MHVDFLVAVVRRKKTDDIAGTVSRIDVVIIVEDHVFRSVDRVKSDCLDRPQPVIEGVWR